jgi:hypothetical protein
MWSPCKIPGTVPLNGQVSETKPIQSNTNTDQMQSVCLRHAQYCGQLYHLFEKWRRPSIHSVLRQREIVNIQTFSCSLTICNDAVATVSIIDTRLLEQLLSEQEAGCCRSSGVSGNWLDSVCVYQKITSASKGFESGLHRRVLLSEEGDLQKRCVATWQIDPLFCDLTINRWIRVFVASPRRNTRPRLL